MQQLSRIDFHFCFFLTVWFSLPFSHPELTFHFSLLLSFLRVRFSLPFFTSPLTLAVLQLSMIQFSLLLSFRLCCFLALFFHIIILSRYAAAVQNSYSLFTFAFFRMVYSSGPFLPTLLNYSVAFLPLFHITTLLMSSTHSRRYCCPKQRPLCLSFK